MTPGKNLGIVGSNPASLIHFKNSGTSVKSCTAALGAVSQGVEGE